MPAKRQPPYQYVKPENWAHPAAQKIDDLYRDSIRRADSLPAVQGARPMPRDYSIPKVETRREGMGRGPMQYVEPSEQDVLTKRRAMVPRVPRRPGSKGMPFPWPYKPPRLPGPGMVMDLLDLADKMAKGTGGAPVPGAGLPAGGVLKCSFGPAIPFISHVGGRSGNVNAADCGLGFQAWLGAPGAFDPAGISSWVAPFTIVTLAANNPNPCSQPPSTPMGSCDRATYAQVWHWTASGNLPADPTAPLFVIGSPLSVDTMPDPNEQRRMAGEPDPLRSREPRPSDGPLPIASWPLTGPETWSHAYTSSDGSHHRGPPPGRTVTRYPDKEVPKRMSASKAFAVTAFHALDSISEFSEIVDAFYESLPADVRKRWEAKHGRDTVFPLDQAGQYGIDGADWKAKALYYNADKIDVETAIKNVIKNAVEDRILGDIHRSIPRQSGAAFSDAQKELSKQIDAWMDYLLNEAEGA